MPQIPLTQSDVIFAIAGAIILFVIYRFLSGAARMLITRASELRFHPDQQANILENCYRTFPIESLNFEGTIFQRGTAVRITTTRQTTVEGKFIGTNQAEMICLMTDSSVIAQEIGAIIEIQAL